MGQPESRKWCPGRGPGCRDLGPRGHCRQESPPASCVLECRSFLCQNGRPVVGPQELVSVRKARDFVMRVLAVGHDPFSPCAGYRAMGVPLAERRPHSPIEPFLDPFAGTSLSYHERSTALWDAVPPPVSTVCIQPSSNAAVHKTKVPLPKAGSACPLGATSPLKQDWGAWPALSLYAVAGLPPGQARN